MAINLITNLCLCLLRFEERIRACAQLLQLERIDTNGDGTVDEQEFVAAGGSKEAFKQHDLNGDGVLDADELALGEVHIIHNWGDDSRDASSVSDACHGEAEERHVNTQSSTTNDSGQFAIRH